MGGQLHAVHDAADGVEGAAGVVGAAHVPLPLGRRRLGLRRVHGALLLVLVLVVAVLVITVLLLLVFVACNVPRLLR